MYSKIFASLFLLACAQAAPVEQYQQATSFASFNDHHNTIHHIQSAPAIVKAPIAIKAAPVQVAPVHVAPLHVAPVAIKAAPHGAQSFSSVSFGQAAPVAKLSAPVAYHAAPVVVKAAPIAAHHEEEHYAPAKYEFAYGVEDHHTGDIHSHKEARDGDITHGEYSLHEADGTIRTVKYTVDKHSGFNAVVERSGHAVHAQPAPHH